MRDPKDVPDPQDIQDVILEEKSRGRRKIDTDKLRERRDLERLLQINNLGEFLSAMRESLRAYGKEPDPELLDAAAEIWKSMRRF